MEVSIPCDHNWDFDPEIVHKRSVPGLEEKVMAMYARGMSTRDIHDRVSWLYEVAVSAETVSG